MMRSKFRCSELELYSVHFLLTGFAMGSELARSIYLKIISFAVSIHTAEVILTTSRKDFSAAAYSLKFVHLLPIHSCFPANMFTQTFSNIFISPSSSEFFVDADENGAARKKQRTASNSQKKATKRNVATILGMEGQVTSRSIAYAAVLVCLSIDTLPKLFHLLIADLHSWPSICLMPLIGLKSTIISTTVRYTR